MARVIIVTDPRDSGEQVVLDEHVDTGRLSDEREAGRFVERLGWAINDAEEHSAPTGPQALSESAARLGGGSQTALAPHPHPRVAVLLAREAA